jgi:hypothetical protein
VTLETLDWIRSQRDLYAPGREPVLVTVPEFSFAMVDGTGDPNGADFHEAVSGLFAMSYAARFVVKRAGLLEYSVFPLEGLWSVREADEFGMAIRRAGLRWTLLIRQPDEVDQAVVEHVRAHVARRVAGAVVDRLRLERFAEGEVAQVLHVGPYRTAAATTAGLHEFIAEQGRRPVGRHHEIYLGDPRRAAPDRLRTVLRQPVRPAALPAGSPRR